MSDRNKNKRSLPADFFRYQHDKLSGKERNSFERELQRDDFAREAAEGYSLVSGEQAVKDINDLQNRLKTRTVRRQRIIFYRVAASVAILMMISTLLVFIARNKSGIKLADNSVQTHELNVTKSQPLTEPAAPQKRSEIPPVKSAKRPDNTVAEEAERKPAAAAAPAEKPSSALNPSNDSRASVKVESDRIYASEDKRSLLAKARSKDIAQTFHNAKGIIISSEDNQPLPGVSGHTPPQPSGGKPEFDKYIKENLHRPDTLSTGQRAVVVVSFLVRKDGKIDSIRILRSPGRLFSEEAIRVLKSGPTWKPAQDGETIVEEEVRLRVVFK